MQEKEPQPKTQDIIPTLNTFLTFTLIVLVFIAVIQSTFVKGEVHIIEKCNGKIISIDGKNATNITFDNQTLNKMKAQGININEVIR